MAKHFFKKPEVATIQGVCVACSTSKQRALGKGRYGPLCNGCHRRRHGMIRGKLEPHQKHKGPVCERCGFVPEDPCQLDVDHIDGDHHNEALSNYMTLCANCHRLKTKLAKDGPYRCQQVAA